MKTNLRKFSAISCFAIALLLATSGPLVGAPNTKNMAMPDFTRGDKIPDGATNDWNLGATGARGWMYCNNMVTSDARQVYITQVDADSPADGVLKVGDVILGIGDKRFSHDPRTEIGRALTVAESEIGGGNLPLIRWRAGKTESVVVKLPVLGTYSATAPYDCPKSTRILEQGCKVLAERIADPSYRPNAITRSLNAMALLASGNEEYLPLAKKEARWASDFSAKSFQTWWYGYVIMFLSEYVMQTGDTSVMQGLQRLAMEAANGQSIVGSWGHKFAGPDGRLLGYGMMNAPGLPLTTGLILARQAGVNDPRLDRAILRSERLLRFYIGKGSIPYGDHGPWIETHEDNGKNGIAALMFNLLDDAKGTTYFSRMSVASHGAERDCGHTGNFFNILWALPGVSLSGPQATGAWMKQYGARYFDMARRWDGSFVHQGGEPMVRPDAYKQWDATGAYLLAYAIPLKKLRLTGKPSVAPQIDADTAQSLIQDGVGWSRNDRYSYYDKMTTEQLLERLCSWSPVVRERAAIALGRGKADITDRLIEMLGTADLYTQYGACQALKMQRERGAKAVPTLLKTFNSDDLWLRVMTAEALAGIGEPAKVAVPALLERLAQGPTATDPRNMEQRYLSFAVFNRHGGLLGQSLEGVDRDLLMKAVRAGLLNEDGRARGSFTSVYQNLSFEELMPLLPAIHQAIREPSPSGIMFADQVRMGGLELFTQHKISEGIELLAFYARHQKPHGSEKRIIKIMNMLKTYGAHAQRAIPQLQAAAHYFEHEEPDFPRHLSLGKAKLVRETIKAIEASTAKPKLISLSQ